MHSKTAAVEAGDFFCTADVENYDRDMNGLQCEQFSLDGFLTNINNRTTVAFDSVNDVVDTIGLILPPIISLAGRLGDSTASLVDMENALDGYQMSSTEVRDLLNGLNGRPPGPPNIANLPDATVVPEITDAAIKFLADALVEVDMSKMSVEDLQLQVQDEINNLNDIVTPEVDAIQTDILKLTGDIQDTVYDTMKDLEKSYGYSSHLFKHSPSLLLLP